MTISKADDDRQRAARLRAALNARDALTCAEAEALLPDLVAAEQAGADVDADLRFAALLRHLDECAGCLALYETLSEEAAALDAAEAPAPLPHPARVPTFFPAPRRTLRVLEGLRRRFALDIPLPTPLPLVGTLGGAPQATLLDEALGEVAGSPMVRITLAAQGEGATVRVALSEAAPSHPWQVELRAGTFTATTPTDERGVATFRAVPLAGVTAIAVVCAE